MNILGRILVLLVAALVIVGITCALAGTNTGTSAGRPQRDSAPQMQVSGSSTPSMQGDNADFDGGHERGGGESMGLFGLVEVGKNLAIIAVLVALVAPLTNVLRRRKERGSIDYSPSPPDAQVSL